MLDRETGRSRGFAFVEFSTPEEAQQAVEQFHGKDLGGRQLTVNIARPREERLLGVADSAEGTAPGEAEAEAADGGGTGIGETVRGAGTGNSPGLSTGNSRRNPEPGFRPDHPCHSFASINGLTPGRHFLASFHTSTSSMADPNSPGVHLAPAPEPPKAADAAQKKQTVRISLPPKPAAGPPRSRFPPPPRLPRQRRPPRPCGGSRSHDSARTCRGSCRRQTRSSRSGRETGRRTGAGCRRPAGRGR